MVDDINAMGSDRPERGERPERSERPMRGGGRGRFQRRRVCAFCVDKVDHIDYKDINTLRRYVSDQGQIEFAAEDRYLRPSPTTLDHSHQAGAAPGAPAIHRRTHPQVWRLKHDV